MRTSGLGFKEMIGTANHSIRVEHFTDWLEQCPESTRHILRVSVEYINVWGHSTRINEEAWIEDSILTPGYIYKDVNAWKADQVPMLSGNVIRLLYKEMKKGTVYASS